MDCGGKPRASSASSASARPQPAAAGASSLSLSLEDELATAIHGALRGAVEVAVLEVSRLVGQALGGARRQMRGTLQENRSLKERLLVAERELDALRGARRPGSPRGSVRAGVSFGETCEDGQVRSRRWTRGPPAAEEDRVNVYGGSRPVGMEFDGERTEAAATTSPGPDIKRVRVKEEESEAAGGSRPASDPVAGHKFEADCPPRARSKLLRDRRPEPSEESDSDSFALSDPSVFSSATVRSNGLVPAAGGFSLVAVPFPNPFRSGDAESATPSQQPCSLRAGSSGSIGSSTPRMHICGDCGVVFQQLAELRRHCQQHSGARPRRAKRPALAPGCSPYRCSHCGRDFNRLENLKTHLRIHTGERPYSCLVCGVRFRHSGALTRHFRIHTGEKPYVCSRCGRAFRNCGGLRFHQQSHVREGQSAAD